MLNLAKVVRQLQKEREQAQKRVEQLDQALAALGGFGASGSGGTSKLKTKRRAMSPAARKKIAAAQRARWAKWKASRKA